MKFCNQAKAFYEQAKKHLTIASIVFLTPMFALLIVNGLFGFDNSNMALSYSSLILACVGFIGLIRYENWIDREKALKRSEVAANCYCTIRQFGGILDELTNLKNPHWKLITSLYKQNEDYIGDDGIIKKEELKDYFTSYTSLYFNEINNFRSSVERALLFLDQTIDEEVIDGLTELNGEFSHVKIFYCGSSEPHGICSLLPRPNDQIFFPVNRASLINGILKKLRNITNSYKTS